MIEFLMTLAIFALAAGGIGLGLFFGRAPAKTSCGAAAGHRRTRCADCPLKRGAKANTEAEAAS